ncbi:hypothetical protein E3N88_09260 [Mikania micrantha]|uniref:Uncharacterized protein n=1 Tax=Mikania micrantha TaxID=192012 RepID=A0A5N6PIL7_9ASTR|nr:hypothetical protein E3N88_09260 [Mikania micrantha]
MPGRYAPSQALTWGGTPGTMKKVEAASQPRVLYRYEPSTSVDGLRSPVKEQACRLCVVSSVKEILGMLELSAAR